MTQTILTLALVGAALAQTDQIDIPEIDDSGVVDAAAQPTGTTMAAICTGYTYTGNRTATGVWPTWGLVATDPSVVPMGTQMTISGYGDQVFRAADTGGGVRGAHIDIFFPTYAQAIAFGFRPCSVTLLR